jgi:hypothetical protein
LVTLFLRSYNAFLTFIGLSQQIKSQTSAQPQAVSTDTTIPQTPQVYLLPLGTTGFFAGFAAGFAAALAFAAGFAAGLLLAAAGFAAGFAAALAFAGAAGFAAGLFFVAI